MSIQSAKTRYYYTSIIIPNSATRPTQTERVEKLINIIGIRFLWQWRTRRCHLNDDDLFVDYNHTIAAAHTATDRYQKGKHRRYVDFRDTCAI